MFLVLSISCFIFSCAQINTGKIPGILSGDRQVLDELMNNADVTPAMRSTIRVVSLLTNSAGFDTGKVHESYAITAGGIGGSIPRRLLV